MLRQIVLIVDDVPQNIQLINECLGDDYEVIFATSGEDALRLAREQTPDLILLDVMMPVMDGHEVCRRLKADAATRAIPVIFVTALSQEQDEIKGLELGAIDYITKPINPHIVRARVKNQLEVKRYRDLLENMATAADRAKKEFLRSINHELRTPLTPILGMTDLVLSGEKDQEKRRYLSIVQNAALKLLNMVEDLIETSRLEGEEAALDIRPFKLKSILNAAMSEMAPDAQEKGLRLTLRMTPEVPELVQMDRGKLYKLLKMLLGNALKFTAEGEVSLAVQARSEGERTLVRFSVIDTGIGLKEEDAERIFSDFTQSDAAVTRSYGGLGLGLTLAKRLATRLGGKLWAEPGSPKGAVFHFEIAAMVGETRSMNNDQ
ncbi:hybrid sensor histidine kinase/response regulator [Geomesophilobacter sediminis]|uniref:histidine kinase n=1 Tax=Geomesophilobacter sediminis TaxID=2798584 RepID=A0A8J7M1F0_9BACT|nr:hybrid sensor histidine kinase/response regulator [Geomesophilobacter sediminis]MBJ6726886.1 hybrid sensor histidine kinase/response regulator [Geomesophilobacter sediminis]